MSIMDILYNIDCFLNSILPVFWFNKNSIVILRFLGYNFFTNFRYKKGAHQHLVLHIVFLIVTTSTTCFAGCPAKYVGVVFFFHTSVFIYYVQADKEMQVKINKFLLALLIFYIAFMVFIGFYGGGGDPTTDLSLIEELSNNSSIDSKSVETKPIKIIIQEPPLDKNPEVNKEGNARLYIVATCCWLAGVTMLYKVVFGG
jgi:hypothetical protein